MENSDRTPSSIRQTETLVGLRAEDGKRVSRAPVLTVSRSTLIWQKARLPVIVLCIALFLLAIGLITNDHLVAQNVQKTIDAAQTEEARGTVQDLKAASKTLSALAERHPSRSNANAAWAWQAVLEAVLLGPQPELTEKARSAISRADEESDLYLAAKAGVAYLSGEHESALGLADKGLKSHPKQPRLGLARALALSGLGQDREAIHQLELVNLISPKYAPVSLVALDIALDLGDHRKALDFVKKLRSVGAGDYLKGSLATLAISLPKWSQKPPGAERIKALVEEMGNIKPLVDAAPPKLRLMGRSLIARIHMLVGDFDEAHEALSKAASQFGAERVFAWYALATKLSKGPVAALALLDSRADITGPEILDLRAQCLLELHRVNAAAKIIQKLKAANALPKRQKALRWSYLVKQGDLKSALAEVPEVIEPDNLWPALELYYQLKERGDRTGILDLVNRFGGELKTCANAIKNWHSRRTRRGLRALKLDSDNDCVKALAVRLLRKRTEPQALKDAVEAVRPKTGRNLLIDIDRALITWMVDGQVPAAELLNEIRNLNPKGPPLLCALANAYLEMELPKIALKVLEGVETPLAEALRIEANRMTKGNKTQKMVRAALKKYDRADHPILEFLHIESLFTAGKYQEVADAIEETLPRAGQWAAEIAEMGAKAVNIESDRHEADSLLVKASRRVGADAGMDEAWEVRLAQARMYLRRGGKFDRRAVYTLTEMEKEGIVDPRAMFHLAVLRTKDGNEKIAIRRLKDVLAIDPTFKAAYAKLEELEELDAETAAMKEKIWPQ